MGHSSKAPRTKFDRHFSEKGIGAWEGCLLRCLETPLFCCKQCISIVQYWLYWLIILFDKSAKKKGFLNDNILAVLEGEREIGTYSRQAFFILLVFGFEVDTYSMATKYSSMDSFPGDTLYSKTKPQCTTTSNSNHLPWALNHLSKTPKIPLPNRHLLYSWKLSQTTPFCKWQWPHFRAD